MKVNHLEEYDTHSVIGGQVKTIQSFEIAQTAEFFTVLSSTLYSNKPLAVIREVVCNAWDAHKASDRNDTPIHITLDESNLIIRDFGLGIHPDNMHPIYCIYGNSTKANDGNQTGGFGLGSKAPFAYSDHFTVTTYHEGLKTVYAISRGSPLTQGKPDMRVIVQVPTTETGLEVNIPIKEDRDVSIFDKIIKQIIPLGEINATLNGEPIEVIPISKAENNIFITSVALPDNNYVMYVRYGNVVYPIPSHESYADPMRNITNNLSNIPNEGYNRRNGWKLIVEAPANTISVTPSRESLSMTEITINTLKGILEEISPKFDVISKKFEEKLYQYIDIYIDRYWLNAVPHKLLIQSNRKNTNITDDPYPNHLFNMDEIAHLFATKSENIPRKFQEKLFLDGLQSLVDNNFRRKQDIFKFMQIIKHENTNAYIQAKTTFKKEVLRPIIKSIVKHPILKIENMYITREKQWHIRSTLSTDFEPILKANPGGSNRNSLLQAVVVITSSKSAYDSHYSNNLFGAKTHQYVYVTPRKEEHKQAAIEHFKKLGFYVVDFMTYYDSLPSSSPAQIVPPKPKVQGLITLESLIDIHGNFKNNGHRNDKYPHKRIINPEFVFQPHKLSGSEWDQKFFDFQRSDDSGNYGRMVVNLIGSKGGIVVNGPQYETYMRKGVKDGYVYLVENIANEMLTNPRIRSYLEFLKIADDKLPKGLSSFLSVAAYSSVLTKKYNLPNPLTPEDNIYLTLYNRLKEKVGGRPYPGWETLMADKIKLIEDIQPSPNTINLINIFENNKLIDLINWDNIEYKFRVNRNPDERIKLEILIINTLG